MKTNTILKLSTACAAILFLYGNAAQATEQEGVSCPSGSTAERSNNNKTLKCKKGLHVLPSICPPLNNLGHIIPKVRSGIDMCGTVIIPAPDVPSAMAPPLPGMPSASKFTRDVNGANGNVDRFIASHYVFPNGLTVGLVPVPYNPLHDSSKGVSCPSGYSGLATANGIRCFKAESPKPADCDFPWRFIMNGGAGDQDSCQLGVLDNGVTKPQGMTKIQHDFDRSLGNISWILNIKAGNDEWVRRVYKYPESKS
ncbi:hypothetical protein [Thiothrix fructosivorans]|uniref:Uncharacterized protein n=1 Tax=Thiothrix fructosivorans TaxID=111770 RepID=A0A8B0SQ24_9GAMM|nr:hypothetical protein [Thiothrix fructosivorans]MBO0612399.1 hypothetical protein [Thiothrix fructosivorans]QTX12118.1 hypothetical protein J1836_007275 [Thiothrix fructosivorans]